MVGVGMPGQAPSLPGSPVAGADGQTAAVWTSAGLCSHAGAQRPALASREFFKGGCLSWSPINASVRPSFQGSMHSLFLAFRVSGHVCALGKLQTGQRGVR